MKIFISYKYTGEDPKVLQEIIQNICGSLEKSGHGHFCSFWKDNFFKENEFTYKQILEYALKELNNSDIYLTFVNSENKSEGMLIEAGYAIAKNKKFWLAIRKDVHTVFLREMADKIIEFETLEELYKKLSNLN